MVIIYVFVLAVLGAAIGFFGGSLLSFALAKLQIFEDFFLVLGFIGAFVGLIIGGIVGFLADRWERRHRRTP